MSDGVASSWYADLLLAAALALLAGVVVGVPGTPWVLDRLVGVPLLVFLPGYAMASVAFPEAASDAAAPESAASRTPGWPILLGLAVATSVLLVAVVGTMLAALGALSVGPAMAVVVAVTVLAAGAAALRRRATAPAFRRAPFQDGVLDREEPLLGSRKQTLALALAVVALVAAGGVTAAFSSPTADEAFTEFAVLEENESGDLVAEGYPDEIGTTEGHTFHLMLENHEGHAESYTVVVVAQRMDDGTVTSQTRLNATSVDVAAGERTVIEQPVYPERIGEDVRIQFLLYEGDAPETARPDTADVALQVWTDFVSGYANADLDAPTAAGFVAPAIAPADRPGAPARAVEPWAASVRVAAPAR